MQEFRDGKLNLCRIEFANVTHKGKGARARSFVQNKKMAHADELFCPRNSSVTVKYTNVI
jgi:hypothetical protein